MNPYNIAQLRNETWEGRIPVLFQLCEHDVAACTSPQPHLIMIPRCSYVPLELLNSVAWSYFKEFMVHKPNEQDQFWLEDEHLGHALKWQYPAGAMFDRYKLICRSQEDGETTCSDVPWKLTIHVGAAPEETVPPCREEEDLKWRFNQTLKQAVYLQQDTVKPLLNMQKSKHERLWYCLTQHDFEGTCTASPLWDTPSESGSLVFPVRIIRSDASCKQVRAEIHGSEGQCQTVKDLLTKFSLESSTMMCQGIELPEEVTVQAIYKTLRHPDGFLYICVD